MQLSRGWWKALLSWAVAVSLCVVSGGIFRLVVPVTQDDAAAVEQYALPTASRHVDTDSGTGSAQRPGIALALADSAAPAATLASDARDASPSRHGTAVLSAPLAGDGGETERAAAAPMTHNQDKRLNLRITRDSERCPKVICYKWHLVTQRRLKPPRYTKVELAGLRLAPGLRRKVDKGNIDLLIDAVPQHRTINGHDTLVFVAINLAGVTPHDASLDLR